MDTCTGPKEEKKMKKIKCKWKGVVEFEATFNAESIHQSKVAQLRKMICDGETTRAVFDAVNRELGGCKMVEQLEASVDVEDEDDA